MFNLHTLSIAVSSLVTVAQAVTLKDLPLPPKIGSAARRDINASDYSGLDLQSEETFVWGGMCEFTGIDLGLTHT
jgi:hypothetical protein